MKRELHKILLENGDLLEIGVFCLEIGRCGCRWKLDREIFSGVSVSMAIGTRGDTRLRDCKRGKNKDCFGNKQYFFSNLYFISKQAALH
jgi:hypothetical protein